MNEYIILNNIYEWISSSFQTLIRVMLWAILNFRSQVKCQAKVTRNKDFVRNVFVVRRYTYLLVLFVFIKLMLILHVIISLQNWKKRRTADVTKDLEFCHPRWPEERKFLESELKDLDKMSPKYFKDYWYVLQTVTVNIAGHTKGDYRNDFCPSVRLSQTFSLQ